MDNSEKMLLSLLDAYRDEYSDCYDTWRDIERKAQGTITVAGVFLAAVFAFIRQLGNDSSFIKVFLFLAIVLLCITVFCALAALRVRDVKRPPSGQFVKKLFQDLMKYEKGEVRPVSGRTKLSYQSL